MVASVDGPSAKSDLLGVLARLKWKREQKSHELALRRLKQLHERVDLELKFASVSLYEQRHNEVIAAVSARAPSVPAIQGDAVTISSAQEQVTMSTSPFSVPFLRNPAYCGRDDYLSEIHDHLCPSSQNQDMLKFLALCGLGGAGKSQIALEYIYRYRHLYQASFWITCDTPVKIAQGFMEVARKLKLDVYGHLQTQQLVKDWLCEEGIPPPGPLNILRFSGLTLTP
jgi:hypothetical protein